MSQLLLHRIEGIFSEWECYTGQVNSLKALEFVSSELESLVLQHIAFVGLQENMISGS